jgi:hypothetical protein
VVVSRVITRLESLAVTVAIVFQRPIAIYIGAVGSTIIVVASKIAR